MNSSFYASLLHFEIDDILEEKTLHVNGHRIIDSGICTDERFCRLTDADLFFMMTASLQDQHSGAGNRAAVFRHRPVRKH